MRDILITSIVFGAIPFILMRPYIGVYVWSWLSYMNPHRLAYGFAYSMPFAAITAGALIIGLFTSKERNKFPITPLTVIWILFILWFTISTLTAIDFDLSLIGWKRAIKIQLTTFITIILITNRERLNWLIWVIALSIGFFGIKGGLFVIATAGSYRVWGPPDSFIYGNNEIALALLMIMPFLWYLRTQVVHKWVRHGILLAMLLTSLSIISSYSRGAFVAFAAVAFVFWMKSSKKLVIGLVLLVVGAGIINFMPARYMERIQTIESYKKDGSAMGRINAWRFAFNLAKDHPLTGGGFKTFTPELFRVYAPNPENFHDSHSIYFQVLGEQGFVGLFLFLSLLYFTYRECAKIKKRVKNIESMKWAETLASMVQVSLIAYGVGGAFLGLAYFDLPYHIMSISLLCTIFVKQELKSLEENNIVVNNRFSSLSYK